MMESRGGNGLRKRHAPLDHAYDREDHLADDARPSRGAQGEVWFFTNEHDRRAHARKGAFARLQAVGFGTDEAKSIWSARGNRKIIHLIVEYHTGPRNDDFGPEWRIDRCCDRNPIAFRIGGCDVGGMLPEHVFGRVGG